MSDPLHALVCNGHGYDKSITRALALYVRASNVAPPLYKDLAERVLNAETEARLASPCDVLHPMEGVAP